MRRALVLLAMASATALAGPRLAVTAVATGLDHPWGLAFLPDGRMLVTLRPGRLRTVGPGGQLGPPVVGVPEVDARGQGALLDVALDPDFAVNGRIYLSYAEAGTGADAGKNGTAVARGKLAGNQLTDVVVIFRQRDKVASIAHFGSRLIFDRRGRLFITLGERLSHRDDAQNLGSHLGKTIRFEADGRVPADNPFVKTPGALPEIWSYGHRNMQGPRCTPGPASSGPTITARRVGMN